MDPSAGVAAVGSTVCVSLFFPLLRWLLHVNVFEPLALSQLRPIWQKHHPKISPEQMRLGVDKYCESLWKLLVYLTFFCIGVAALWRQPFLLDTWQFWSGWPNQPFPPLMRLLYHGQLGFYVSSIFMIIFWEIRRRDFAVMFSHHIATALLIGASLHYRFWRVGTLVMTLHDTNDVLLEAAKLAKYGRREAASTALFGAFVAAWAGLRLAAFPHVIIRSTLTQLPAVLGGAAGPLYYGFNGLLCLLLGLHCYWFSLILRVVWLTLTTGAPDDVRED